jgi:hypothetical protein
VRGDGHVIAGYRGFVAYLTKPLDSFMAGHDHGADQAPQTVPAR